MARPQAKAARPAPRRTARWIYAFGGGRTDGRAKMKDLLGGKGANLAEMSRLGLPVPPGFTISTDVCTYYYTHGRSYPPGLRAHVTEGTFRARLVSHRVLLSGSALPWPVFASLQARFVAATSEPDRRDVARQFERDRKSVV